jgi:thioredoxin-disulfide reductase
MDTPNFYDLIIIGGGPAAITAGIYSMRQQLNALLITKDFGGQIKRKAVAIENYPGFSRIAGPDLIKRFEKHLRRYPIDIEKDEVLKIKKTSSPSARSGQGFFIVTTKSKTRFKSIAVIIATGADPRPLEVPGEKELIGKGVSYCPLCDGPLFYNKTVAVIGGGNSGFEAALFLVKYAKKVYILEYSSNPVAFKDLQNRAKASKKVEVIINADVKEIKGKKFVESLVYQDNLTKEEKQLDVDGIFVAIGNQPATSFVKELVEFSKRDEIKINPRTCETKTPGLFAAGDVTDVFPKQIVVAAGEGAKAAINAYNYIQKIKK